jgi:hypothetical protein
MKNDPLFLEIKEEIDREKMVKFFSKYGQSLVVAGIVLIIAIGIYNVWKQNQVKQSKLAGNEVYAVMKNMDKPLDEFSIKKLDETSKKKNYFEVSLLNKAAAQTKAENFTGAVETYDVIVKNTSADKGLRDLAALNAANLLLETNPKATGLEKRLMDITADDNAFKYNARELLASFYAQNGEQEKADKILQALSSDANVPVTIAKRAKQLSHTDTVTESVEE